MYPRSDQVAKLATWHRRNSRRYGPTRGKPTFSEAAAQLHLSYCRIYNIVEKGIPSAGIPPLNTAKEKRGAPKRVRDNWGTEYRERRVIDDPDQWPLVLAYYAGKRGEPMSDSAHTPPERSGQSRREPIAESECVKLFGPDEPPEVNGVPMKRLTAGEYAIVQTLIEARNSGERITKDLLPERSRHPGARKLFERLRTRYPAWADVLLPSGSEQLGYRIK